MSITDTATTPAETLQTGIFGRTARRLFGVFSWKASSAFGRLAGSGREVPPEVFRFPLF